MPFHLEMLLEEICFAQDAEYLMGHLFSLICFGRNKRRTLSCTVIIGLLVVLGIRRYILTVVLVPIICQRYLLVRHLRAKELYVGTD
jgi:hypothetical protein